MRSTLACPRPRRQSKPPYCRFGDDFGGHPLGFQHPFRCKEVTLLLAVPSRRCYENEIKSNGIKKDKLLLEVPQPTPALNAPQPNPTLDAPQPIPTLHVPQPIPTLHVPQPIPTLDAPQPIPTLHVPQPIPTLDAPQPIPTLDAPQPNPTLDAPYPEIFSSNLDELDNRSWQE